MKNVLVLALTASFVMPAASFAAPPMKTWSDIRSLKPGTEVTLRTTSTSDSKQRYFINANEDAIYFLNLSDPSLPTGAAKRLRQAIERHPYYFPPPQGETVTLDAGVTLGGDGLYLAGQKVANYDVFAERIARADVEDGTIQLELKPSMRTSTKVLIGVGVVFGAIVLAFAITCATQGCD